LLVRRRRAGVGSSGEGSERSKGNVESRVRACVEERMNAPR
jgi:hypothetical protein